jgi:hypothetical protein
MEQEIDGWIEQLTQCKQLSELDVKRLCDKVCDKGLAGECCAEFCLVSKFSVFLI